MTNMEGVIQLDNFNNSEEVYEIIEQNILGDHIVVKRYKTKIQAQQFCDMMNDHSVDGSTYYVNNLEDEWREVAKMILEEEEQERTIDRENNLWYKFMRENNIKY